MLASKQCTTSADVAGGRGVQVTRFLGSCPLCYACSAVSVSGRTQTFCQPGGRTYFCHLLPEPASPAEPMVAYLGNTLNHAANSRVGSIKCLHNGSEGHLTLCSHKLREKPFAGCVASRNRRSFVFPLNPEQCYLVKNSFRTQTWTG